MLAVIHCRLERCRSNRLFPASERQTCDIMCGLTWSRSYGAHHIQMKQVTYGSASKYIARCAHAVGCPAYISSLLKQYSCLQLSQGQILCISQRRRPELPVIAMPKTHKLANVRQNLGHVVSSETLASADINHVRSKACTSCYDSIT